MCNNIRLPPELQHTVYASLHNHISYNDDGVGSPEKLVQYCKSIGMSAVALTSHGTCAYYVDFLQLCKDNDVQPILGQEFYFRIEGLQKRAHITVLSSGFNGYRNIVEMSNAAHMNFEQGRGRKWPILTLDIISEFCGEGSGITFLSGCPASYTFHDDISVAESYISELVKRAGKGNVYLELMDTMGLGDYLSRPIYLSDKFNLPVVASNDVHLATPGLGDIHKIANTIRKGFSFDSFGLHPLSKEELWGKLEEKIPYDKAVEAIQNIEVIVNKSEVPELKGEPQLPDVSHLREDFYVKIKERLEQDILLYPERESELRNRLQTELTVIEDKGFIDYFIIVDDLVQHARNNGAIVSARGSAGGSYLGYLLEFSNIHPILHGLLFQRFLNPLRSDYPDIDIDIYPREILTDYAKEKYNLRQVATFAQFNHASLVRGIERALRSLEWVSIPSEVVTKASEFGIESNEFEEFCSYSPKIKLAYDEMVSTFSHQGRHASALASLNPEIDIPVPIETSYTDEPVIAYVESGVSHALAKIGMIKFDILTVNGLGLLVEMEKLSGVKPPKVIPDNDEIFTLFDTKDVEKIFQFGTNTAREIAQKMPIRSIDDIAIATSLNRPSALDSGSHITFLENSIDMEWWPELLRPILEKNRGVMIYQEDFMKIVAEICSDDGATDNEKLGYANTARTTIIPKTTKLLSSPEWIAANKELHDKFFKGGVSKGISENKLQAIWELLKSANRYSFCKAHASSYAWLAGQQLYYKHHYPSVYYTVNLRALGSTSADLTDTLNLMIEAVSNGLEIVPPHINYSSENYELVDNKLYMPLRVIKGHGEASSEKVINERKQNGDYKSLSDFANRAGQFVNKTVRLKLYQMGALKDIPGDLFDLGVVNRKVKNENYVVKPKDTYLVEAGDDEVFVRINKLGKLGQLPTINGVEVNVPVGNKNFHKVTVSGDLIVRSSAGNQVTVRVRRIIEDEIPEYVDPKMATKNCLGFAIPTKNTVKFLEAYKDIEDVRVGYVTDTYEKISKSNNKLYWFNLTNNQKVFYTLEASNTKWLKNMKREGIPYGGTPPEIEVGSFVKFKVSSIGQYISAEVY